MQKIWAFLGVGVVGVMVLVASLATWVWVTIPPELDPDELPSHLLDPPAPGYLAAVEQGRTLARALAAEEKLPGLSLAVAVDGHIIWAEGFGWADLEARTPVTPATRFRIGGISETLTSAAAGLLVERGRLDLDAPVQHYLPNFPEKEWPITIRQAMAHTAGLRQHLGEDGILLGAGCRDDSERLALFADDPLLFRPGSRYQYSASGSVLAGAVVAAVAGQPYLDFVQSEVLMPLKMQSTAAEEPGSDSARSYYPRLMLNPRYGLQDAPELDLSCYLAAVGFQSTPSDLVRFGSAMMSGDWLRPETVKELQTPFRLDSGDYTGEALGWSVYSIPLGPGGDFTRVAGRGLGRAVRRRPLSAVTVGGQVAGTTSTFLLLPEHRIAIALASNVSGAEKVPVLAIRLADIFVAASRDDGS